MGSQKDDIRSLASSLGINSGNSSSELDQLKKIAEAVGMSSYNGMSNADTDELQNRLRNLSRDRDLRKQAENAGRGKAVGRDDYSKGGGQNNGARNARNVSNGQGRNGASSSATDTGTDPAKLRQKVADVKMAIAKEAIKKVLAAEGVPEQVTEKALDSDIGEKALKKAMNKKSLPQRIFGGIMKRGEESFDSDKSLSEKSAEEEAKKTHDGEISFALPMVTISWLSIIGPMVSVVLIFLLIIIGALNDEKTSSMVLAGMATSSEKKEILAAVGRGDDVTELAVGKGNNMFPDEYYKRLASLGNVYSSQKECEGSECLERNEFLYYLKIADIHLRYKNKYNVELDWYLIAATDLYFSRSTEDTMAANLSNYDKDSVEDYSTLSELDWDNDFTNMYGYQYLDADDSRYDLNILAKNMVKKKTVQTCTDGSGSVVSRQEDEDVEDMYFELGAKNRLSCGAGQTHHISSTYTLDKDKYDEFLLEYIDKKMYTRGSGKGDLNSVSGNSLSNAFVNLAVAQLDDPSAKGGEKYWRSMGFNHRVAWCAAFVTWNIQNTYYGDVALKDIIKVQSAAVYVYMNYFYNSEDSNINFVYNDNCSTWAGRNGSGKYTPKEGDLIFFDWINSSGNTRWNGTMPTCWGCGADHIGIVQRVEDGNIITIEGNSGDAVHERSYPINSCQVIAFGSWY